MKKIELNPEEINKLYWEDNLTILEISHILECSTNPISRTMKENNIPVRKQSDILREKYKGENNPNWKGGHFKICKKCGNEFWVTPSNKNSEYCSKSCYAKTRVGEKNPFYGKRHNELTLMKQRETKLGKNNPMYGKLMPTSVRKKISKSKTGIPRLDMIGEKNPMWKGGYEPYYGPNWKEQRRRVLSRDNHICQICGAKETNQEHDVHHIIPFRKFGREYYKDANKLSNLITLCASCHRKIHKNWKGYAKKCGLL